MKIKANNNGISEVKKTQEEIPPFKGPLKRSQLAKKLLIKGENLREFEEMRDKILAETLTQTEIEKVLCEKIISYIWKRKRAMEIERNLLNQKNEISEEENLDESWGSSSRKRVRNIKKVRIDSQEIKDIIQYQFELEKGFQKALERLREEQLLRSTLSIQKPAKGV